MKRAKKSKPDIRRKFTLSEKQLEKVKNEVTSEAVMRTGMLYLAALAEKGWSEDEIVEMFERISHYIKYIDDKVVKINEVQEIIERRTGIMIKGKW